MDKKSISRFKNVDVHSGFADSSPHTDIGIEAFLAAAVASNINCNSQHQGQAFTLQYQVE